MLGVGVATVLTCLIRKKDLASLIWSTWLLPLFLMGVYGADGTPMVYQLFFFRRLENQGCSPH